MFKHNCRNGEKWADLRKPTQEKMLRPAVTSSYIPLIENVTDDFIAAFKRKDKVDDLLDIPAKVMSSLFSSKLTIKTINVCYIRYETVARVFKYRGDYQVR